MEESASLFQGIGEQMAYASASLLLFALGFSPESVGTSQILLAIVVLGRLSLDALAVARVSVRAAESTVDRGATICLLRAVSSFCPVAVISMALVHIEKPSMEHTTVTGLLLLLILMVPAAFLFQWCALSPTPEDSRGLTCMLILMLYLCLDLDALLSHFMTHIRLLEVALVISVILFVLGRWLAVAAVGIRARLPRIQHVTI